MSVTQVVSNAMKVAGREITKHSPTILTALSCAGLVTTAIFSSKAGENIAHLRSEKVDELEKHSIDELTFMENVEALWKNYIPTGVMGCATIGCMIAANSIHLRRTAAIASLYSITEAALKEYQTKVVETLGKNKEQKIRDEINKDRLAKNPIGTNEVIFTGKGDTLCFDSLSARYFKCDIEKIKRIQNELNHQLMSDMFISVNDLYFELGLSNTVLGDEMGWNVENGLIDISFSAHLDENGVPCLVLNYSVIPKSVYL